MVPPCLRCLGAPWAAGNATRGRDLCIEPPGHVRDGRDDQRGKVGRGRSRTEERWRSGWTPVRRVDLLQPPPTGQSGRGSLQPPRAPPENAGIFCHNNHGSRLLRPCKRHSDRAFAVYKRRPARPISGLSARCRTEPTVYSQMVAGRDAPTFGRGQNSWLTGTAAWTTS